MAAASSSVTITVTGEQDNALFEKAVALLEAAKGKVAKGALEYTTNPLLEPDWEKYKTETADALGGQAYAHTKSPLVLVNGEYLGGYSELEAFVGNSFAGVSAPPGDDAFYKELAQEKYLQMLTESSSESGRSYAFIYIKIGDNKAKKVIFELYAKECPRTCENFVALCNGQDSKLRYKGAPFHRVVKDAWIQGGDIVSGRGDGGASIFGETFADESFAVKFDSPGILAMANTGAHTNNSQFFVTLAPLPFLDCQNVAFGRVIRGMPVVRAVERLECVNERPVEKVVLERAKQLDLSSTADLKA